MHTESNRDLALEVVICEFIPLPGEKYTEAQPETYADVQFERHCRRAKAELVRRVGWKQADRLILSFSGVVKTRKDALKAKQGPNPL